MIRLQDIRLRTKLTGLLLLCGLIPLSILWWLRDHQNEQSRLTQTSTRLEAVRQMAASEIKRHLAERRADLEILTQLVAEGEQQARGALEALRDLKRERIESHLANQLQDLTQLSTNPDFVKRVAAIDWLFRQGGRKSDDKHWRETVEGFVPWMQGRQTNQGVEDLYFISPLGDVVYTLQHRADLGSSILQKPLKESPLAVAHRQAMEGVTVQDTLPGAPADHAASLILGVPVKKDGVVIGSLLMRVARTSLARLAQAGVDGQTAGQLILIDGDGMPFEATGTGGKAMPVAETVKKAISDGQEGSGLLTDTNGPSRLGAWAPLRVKGLRWGILATRDTRQIFNPEAGGKRLGLQKFSETAGYFDLFLIHPEGEIFYSVARQADFGTNLITGPYAATNLGQLIRRVVKSRQAGLSDLLPYPPSDNQPAFFMAQPVLDKERIVLIAALQLAPDAITALLHPLVQSTPYRLLLVGPDQKLRSDAFTDPANPTTATAFIGSPATALASAEAIQSGLAGETVTLETRRADGKRVLAAIAPLPLDGFTWTMIVEAEWDDPSTGQGNGWILLAGILLVLVLTLIGYRFLRRTLFIPLEETAFALNRMASGHFGTPDTFARQDEFGALTRSLSTLSQEVTLAGQRIHQAADPLSIRIRRLASQAMLISRESAVGSESLAEVRAAILEGARQTAEENARLIDDRNRLVETYDRLLRESEQLAVVTARAVTEGKHWVHEDASTLHALQERTLRLRAGLVELVKRAQSSPKNGEESGKHGKHGKHDREESRPGESFQRLVSELQAEIAEMDRQIVERLEAANHSVASLDGLMPVVPMPQPAELTPVVALEHNPDRIFVTLDKLDDQLKKNQRIAREIILAAKGVFDITTGPLKQATSYFAPTDPVASAGTNASETVISSRGHETLDVASRLSLDASSASDARDGSGSSPPA
ncbi:hypothetical protein SIID45300_01515 [Candidatus Magnetaquicoccaceae bacterium FCR-1]|uniref:HAMP domain-containing protein n=1 Tax=Candidatus Magnetaquiglobus chichijimensis TaxID=3141448 RepID=A0ABQ0C8I5_9PROT